MLMLLHYKTKQTVSSITITVVVHMISALILHEEQNNAYLFKCHLHIQAWLIMTDQDVH